MGILKTILGQMSSINKAQRNLVVLNKVVLNLVGRVSEANNTTQITHIDRKILKTG